MNMNLLDFLDKSPVNFLAVETLVEELEAAGFQRINPADA